MSKSRDYWGSRLDDVAQEQADRSIEEAEKRLKKIYEEALKQINQDISDLYLRIQQDGEITPLSLYKKDRYIRLKRQIKQAMKGLGNDQNKILEKVLSDAVKGAYNSTGETMGIRFDRIKAEFVESIVNSKWSGEYFSKRVWDNTSMLAREIEKAVIQSVVTGKNKDECIKNIMQKTGNSFSNADRLVRTEISHCVNQAQGKIYTSEGYKQYEILVAQDERTCEVCGALDGAVFEFNDMQEGINYPPLHPRCRCTVIPVLESRKNYAKMNDKEEAAIAQYVSSESYKINRAYRHGIALTETQKELQDNLDSALLKIPVYTGEVYRSISDMEIEDMDAFMKQYAPGNEIVFPAYTSAGTKVFDESLPIQYVIQSCNGRDFRKYNAKEFEILFPRNTQFRVTKVDGNTIYMEEV